MVEKTKAVDDAVAALEQSNLDVQPDDFRDVMEHLVQNGMPPAQARVYAADKLTNASYRELGDAFGITKGSISSAANDSRNTVSNTKELFVQFFGGPKRILREYRVRHGKSTSYCYIVKYLHPPREDPSTHEYGPDNHYGVISVTSRESNNQYDSFTADRYNGLSKLIDGYYESTKYEDPVDAYEVWQLLQDEGASKDDLSAPQNRLTKKARRDIEVRDGVMYAAVDSTDDPSKMESWDGLLRYEWEIVEITPGQRDDSYVIRDEEGVKIERITAGESSVVRVQLLKELVGPVPEVTLDL